MLRMCNCIHTKVCDSMNVKDLLLYKSLKSVILYILVNMYNLNNRVSPTCCTNLKQRRNYSFLSIEAPSPPIFLLMVCKVEGPRGVTKHIQSGSLPRVLGANP